MIHPNDPFPIVSCDGCGDALEHRGPRTGAGVAKTLRAAGWASDGEQLCVTCTARAQRVTPPDTLTCTVDGQWQRAELRCGYRCGAASTLHYSLDTSAEDVIAKTLAGAMFVRDGVHAAYCSIRCRDDARRNEEQDKHSFSDEDLKRILAENARTSTTVHDRLALEHAKDRTLVCIGCGKQLTTPPNVLEATVKATGGYIVQGAFLCSDGCAAQTVGSQRLPQRTKAPVPAPAPGVAVLPDVSFYKRRAEAQANAARALDTKPTHPHLRALTAGEEPPTPKGSR